MDGAGGGLNMGGCLDVKIFGARMEKGNEKYE